MEIDRNREGLVGPAVGDGRSVGLEKVTGTEDTHAALAGAEALITHGAAPSVSSSCDLATSVLVDTKDKTSDAPDEEANRLEGEATVSDAPATSGLMVPHDNTQVGESSGSG
ncbi:hypothetical protein BC629DRAFT_1526450 [Irpex lacteus]|nr:hypothetical protein BC629DRAFT_1526450 [Irpex lacteus]